MRDPKTIKAVSIAITVFGGIVAIIACTLTLQNHAGELEPQPMTAQIPSVHEADLIRCRAVTSTQTDAYETCRKVWAESRRSFLGQKTDSKGSSVGSSAEEALEAKDQSRLPQGYLARPAVGGDQ
ncbi:putative entry exclusion protein TrbK-alt [Bradyrhizobium guangxiense]|uniref:putative entry exclusion protein TrbK-alt n=1 Tax=Bradyrhizobium guangxiense TaxID=1325115 RepID=UPI0010089369|nr:putative entry exclusion protein TrbK-alt [Bradyrhizobium guangxiense]